MDAYVGVNVGVYSRTGCAVKCGGGIFSLFPVSPVSVFSSFSFSSTVGWEGHKAFVSLCSALLVLN